MTGRCRSAGGMGAMHIPHSQQAGSSLIEILVTILILSVGLLGLAALQTNALRFNQDAYQRMVASQQADNMLDRMNANAVGISSGLYNSVSGIGTNPSCTTVCTPQQMAQRDSFEWNTQNQQLLPSGQGTVTMQNNVYRVTVYWDARRTGATGLGCSGNPAVDLNCLRVDLRL